MKHLNRITPVGRLVHSVATLAAALFMLALTGCNEGSELYEINAPDWISAKADSIRQAREAAVVTLIPSPAELGVADNSQEWWSAFTEDFKAEPGVTYQIPFTNYGGSSNWNNFVIILRNATKDFEYAVLRADNWGWGTGWEGAQLAEHCDPSGGPADWGTWLKAMSKAQCTATIINNGNGLADVKVSMLGADGVNYTQNYLNITGIDKDDLYFAFTVDHSHIVFGTPTEEVDSEPVSMTLNNLPRKVLQGTTFEQLIANLTATVTFADGVTKEVSAEEMNVQAIPDMATLGTKTVVAVYNKTYLGVGALEPLVVTWTFDVVDKMYTTYGNLDNSTAFFGARTGLVKIAPHETYVTSFTNYTNGAANWNNYIAVLSKGDLSLGANGEYAVLRADNYGWGTGYAACTHTCSHSDWAAWLTAMNGGRVTVYATNNGDGTADVTAVTVGSDGETYTQTYTGINTVDPDDCYFSLTMEGAHLEFDNVLGNEDNTTAFFGARSTVFNVPAGQTVSTRFRNYTNGAANWNNYIVAVCKGDLSLGADGEYAVLRADNYGWGSGYAACTHTIDHSDWATWLRAMNEGLVSVSVTNKGDGTVDVKAVTAGSDGVTYTQTYTGISPVQADDVNFYITMEAAHIVFE